MPDFIALGVLRQFQGMQVLREQIQALLNLDPSEATQAPLARTTLRHQRVLWFSLRRFRVWSTMPVRSCPTA